MADAIMLRKRGSLRKEATASVAAGEIHQLPDGRAGYKSGLNAASANETVTMVDDENTVIVTKAAGVTFVDGAEVYWDHSANAATYKPVSDRDFFIGTAQGDAGNSATTMNVRLNSKPNYVIDLRADAFRRVDAAGGSGGNETNYNVGGSHWLGLSAGNIAQKTDLFARDGVAIGSNWVLDAQVTIQDGGSGGTPDFNIGLANATHASDFDSIGGYIALHVDGNSLNLNIQSKDGTTTVAANDTTIDYAANTTFWLTIDGRDPADPQCYINGALVASAAVFDVGNGVGAWKPIVHLEKSISTDTFTVYVDRLTLRIAEG